MSTFQLSGIDPTPFAPLFALSAADLAAQGISRQFADADYAFPCRVSLEDVAKGDELLLLPYLHQPTNSPYRASGPVFVGRNAVRATLPPGVVPPYVSRRLMSLRAYDAADWIVEAEVCEGGVVAEALARLFADPVVRYIHLHNAKRGCFSCQATRAA